MTDTYHDEIEIEDMEYDEDKETYFYPCPCGDLFQITKVIRFRCSNKLSGITYMNNLSTPYNELN